MSCKKLDEFLRAASRDEVTDLADHCGASAEYLTHLARGYGNRIPSVVLALSIAQGVALARQSNPALPSVVCADFVEGDVVTSGGIYNADSIGE